MKKIVPLLIFISSLINIVCATAQENSDTPHSVIHFMRTSNFIGSLVETNVYIPHQKQFNVPFGGRADLIVYSTGDMSVGLVLASFLGQGATNLMNVFVKKSGEEYYLLIDANTMREIPKPDGLSYLENRKDFKIYKEDLESPINPESVKDLTKKGTKGQGTCFLISQEGYFVTNYHCVENAKEVTIKGIEGDFTTKYGVTIIATDKTNDLALLKIGNKNVKFINPPFSIRTNGVQQAEKIYALGYPFAETMGKDLKITDGIISSKSGIGGDNSKFQISAAVNPGNSGGPLIDENGNLIGVIYAKSTLAESAGYAIKAGYLELFLKNIEEFKYPSLVNTIKDKPITEKVSLLKNFVFIVETN
ncbi:MAG: serine protease [Bacteroidetes bacterium]|nr:serine protease [Bacteroidota bacterium]